MDNRSMSATWIGPAGLILAGGLLAAGLLRGGEPIVFSSKKSNLARVSTEDAAVKLLKSLPQVAPSSFDPFNITPMPDRSRQREGRRGARDKKSNSEAQKWNWDELQDEDDSDSGWAEWEFAIESDTSNSTGVGSRFREISSTEAVERDQGRKESRIPNHLMSSRQRQKVEERAARGRQEEPAATETDLAAKPGQQNWGATSQGPAMPEAGASQAGTPLAPATAETYGVRLPDRPGAVSPSALGAARDANQNQGRATELESLRVGLDARDFARQMGGLLDPVDLRPDLSLGSLKPVLPEVSSRSPEPKGSADSALGSVSAFGLLPQPSAQPAAADLGGRPRFDLFDPRANPSDSRGTVSRGSLLDNMDIPRRGGTLGR